MSTEDTLNFISRQFHIYFGLFILISGVIGGILNVTIFTTLKTFRETTCGSYLTAVSIVNLGQLLTALFVRILSEGFQIDIRRISWVCKAQIYMAGWCILVSMTIICLATIDQYVTMSTHRHYSSKRLARRGIIVTCIFWGVYCICLAINWGAPFGTCMIINPNFVIYTTHFYFPIILGFLPVSTMIIFSVLAFNSARTLISRQINIVRLSRDRQLTAMTLFHVVFVVITILPYVIYVISSLNQTSKDLEQIARNNLIYTITILIDYSSSSGSFYIYCCVSKRFRKQLIYVLMRVCIDRRRQFINNWNNNQIVPNIETIGDIQPTTKNRTPVSVVSIRDAMVTMEHRFTVATVSPVH